MSACSWFTLLRGCLLLVHLAPWVFALGPPCSMGAYFQCTCSMDVCSWFALACECWLLIHLAPLALEFFFWSTSRKFSGLCLIRKIRYFQVFFLLLVVSLLTRWHVLMSSVAFFFVTNESDHVHVLFCPPITVCI